MSENTIKSISCDGCLHHQMRWYCVKGHSRSIRGKGECRDYLERVAFVVDFDLNS